jgi:AraC-like DNA-binding protein
MAYLRTVRMHASREELRRNECERSIAEVALGCGFTHLGRFSVDYRHSFGETPSQTRNRRRRVRARR